MLILGICSTGCRELNPDFLLEPQAVLSSTTSEQFETPEHSGSGSVTSTAQDRTSGPVGTTSHLSSFTSGSLIDPSSNSPDTETSTESLTYGEFCGSGVELCYPVYETTKTAWQTQDHGPSDNALLLQKPGGLTGGAGPDVQPLVSTIWCKNSGYAVTENAYDFKGGGWGVDLWVAHDEWSAIGWAMVELDGVFAISRRGDGKLACQANLSTGVEVAELEIGTPKDGLHHVECSFHEGKLELRFDSSAYSVFSTDDKAKALPARAHLSVCRGQTLIQAGALRGRVGMLRLWSDVARMQRVTTFERAHVCEKLDIC